MGTIAPVPLHHWYDNNGDPASNYRLFTYLAGTSTKQAVFQDVSLSTPHSNPITIDSAGRPPAGIYLAPLSYKFVFAGPGADDPPSSPVWSQDNIAAVPGTVVSLDVSGLAGEALTAGDVVYLSDGSGALIAGRWYKADADLTYASVTAGLIGIATASIASATDGTIRIAGQQDYGGGFAIASNLYVSATAGALTTTPPTNARLVGYTDSSTSYVLSHWSLTAASRTGPGIVSLAAQVMGSGVKTFDQPPVFEAGGAGASAAARMSGRIHGNTTNVGNVGAGEDNLMTYALPAGVMATDLQVIRTTQWGIYAANATAKRVRAYFGATVLVDSTSLATNGGNWRVVSEVTRTGAATQKATAFYIHTNAAGASVVAAGISAPGETLSGAVTIKVTGESGANDDIVQHGVIVEPVG